MSWFKRTKKGIQTPTEQKKMSQKDFGINLLPERLLTPNNWREIFT